MIVLFYPKTLKFKEISDIDHYRRLSFHYIVLYTIIYHNDNMIDNGLKENKSNGLPQYVRKAL